VRGVVQVMKIALQALLVALIFQATPGILARASTADQCAHEFAAFFVPKRATLPRVAGPAGADSAYAQAPRLSIEAVENLEPLTSAVGGGFHEALRGRYQGRDVFVKISSVKVGDAGGKKRLLSHYMNEVEWVKYLSDSRLGPEFIGIIEKDGHYGLVTEFIEGRHVVPRHMIYLPDNFRPTPALLKRLQEISDALENGRIYTVDLQVRISETNAWVIDPEAWSKATTPEQVAVGVSELQALRNRLEAIIMRRKSYAPFD